MRAGLLLTEQQLQEYGASPDWADRAHALLEHQKEHWEMLRVGYNSLDDVESRTFVLDGHVCRVQHNPGRKTSSAAKVDEKSIRERACFLCADNLPDGQNGLAYGPEYIILCNPFPIFPEHFTIAHRRHLPQEIRSSFPALLSLSMDLEERYTVFYNGPQCGASAPDHLHFQAGSKGFMPLEEEYDELIAIAGEKLADRGGLLVFAVEEFARRFVSLEGDDPDELRKAFEMVYASAQENPAASGEPMMNILSSYQDGEWRVIIFPRARHRPAFFFVEGEGRILISPAAVDMGGVVITPVQRDFERVTEQDLRDMFSEVCMSRERFARLRKRLAAQLKY